MGEWDVKVRARDILNEYDEVYESFRMRNLSEEESRKESTRIIKAKYEKYDS